MDPPTPIGAKSPFGASISNLKLLSTIKSTNSEPAKPLRSEEIKLEFLEKKKTPRTPKFSRQNTMLSKIGTKLISLNTEKSFTQKKVKEILKASEKNPICKKLLPKELENIYTRIIN